MRISSTRYFTATVAVAMPTTAGSPADEDMTFTARFRALTTDEFQAHDLGSGEGQNAYLRDVLCGWEGLIDDTDGEDKPLAFTPEHRDALIRDFFVRRALMETYAQALAGAKRGN